MVVGEGGFSWKVNVEQGLSKVLVSVLVYPVVSGLLKAGYCPSPTPFDDLLFFKTDVPITQKLLTESDGSRIYLLIHIHAHAHARTARTHARAYTETKIENIFR